MRPMKKTTFWQGVVVALLLALIGSFSLAALPLFMTTATAWKLVVTALALGYALYLLQRSGERTGRIVVPSIFLLISLVGFGTLPTGLFVLLQVALIWLVRVLYHHQRLLSALTDLALSALACAAAVWALATGSHFLTLWCFFLVQALFVWIPQVTAADNGGADTTTAGDADFEASRRLADAALRRLATGR